MSFVFFRWRCFVRLENIPSIGQENLLKLTPGFLCSFNLVHDVVWDSRIYLAIAVLCWKELRSFYFHGYLTWVTDDLDNSTSRITGIYR
jgi:hypothetical protein